MLLNCVGRLHGSSERSRLSSLSDLGDLTNLGACEKLLSRSEDSGPSAEEGSSEQQWLHWVEEEARRRTGYLIWVSIVILPRTIEGILKMRQACGLYNRISI
jgi:hypothetical protein